MKPLHRTLALCCIVAFGALGATELRAGEPPARRVIIDQDSYGPAGSNMQAILMLLGAPQVDVLGITVTSGDGWRDENVDHALRLLEIVGRTDVSVYPGAVTPLLNSAARSRAWQTLYGKLYYQGAWTQSWPDQGVKRRTPHPDDPYLIPPSPAGKAGTRPGDVTAAEFLVRQVRKYPGEVTIIAAGPLTNLALAAKLDPQFAALARELVVMGGSYNPRAAGNAFAAEYANAPRREFNFRWDPEAASLVLHEPWRHVTQVPVDPTTSTFFSPALLQRASAGDTPLAQYLRKFGENYPMWDELAVAVWLDPTLVKQKQTLLIDVDTSFTASYGNSLSWSAGESPGLGERAADVVEAVDVPRFEQFTLEMLIRAGDSRRYVAPRTRP